MNRTTVISMPTPMATTRSNTTVSAKVLNESVENVVVVSMDALQFDAYNQPYVLKLSGREYVQVPVTVGINDGTSVQILSGVSAGETVYIRRSVLDMMGMTGG